MSEVKINVAAITVVLLGLLMLVPGLLKLFVMKPTGVTGMLTGLGFPAAGLFAWILIASEITAGAFILTRYKVKYIVVVPVVILLVAAFTVQWGQWPAFIMHLTVASAYVVLGVRHS